MKPKPDDNERCLRCKKEYGYHSGLGSCPDKYYSSFHPTNRFKWNKIIAYAFSYQGNMMKKPGVFVRLTRKEARELQRSWSMENLRPGPIVTIAVPRPKEDKVKKFAKAAMKYFNSRPKENILPNLHRQVKDKKK